MSYYEKVKEWRKKNPDKVAKQNKRYAKKHPETHKKAALKYRQKNIDLIRNKDRINASNKRKNDPEGQKRRNEEYKIRREAKRWEIAGRPRSNICELCQEENLTVFDHCHQTNIFRGWICDRCNKVLGLVKDSTKLLDQMIKYLEKDNGKEEMDSRSNQTSRCSS